MLVSDPRILNSDSISQMIGRLNGNNEAVQELRIGVYKRPDFGSYPFMPGYSDSFDCEGLSISCYGVCDNIQQIIDQCPELEADKDRQFMVAVTPIIKAEQPSSGGWRWHKWGPYIGEGDPQCEYIFNEPVIGDVLVYHIYEREPGFCI